MLKDDLVYAGHMLDMAALEKLVPAEWADLPGAERDHRGVRVLKAGGTGANRHSLAV